MEIEDITASLWESVFDWYGSDLTQAILMLFKILSGFISLLLFLLLVYLLFQLRGKMKKSINVVTESIGAPTAPKRKMAKKWDTILKQIQSGDENAYKFGVIEADKTFDDMLKKIGYEGKDMGERMKNIQPGQMSNIDELWQAHKMRNNIVHDPDFHLTRAQAEKVVKTFEKALKELQVI